MYAVEFESNIDNGFVKIPTQYKKVLQSSRVKVILMVEHQPKDDKSNNKIFDNFLTLTQKVDTVKKLNRDWLNERL